MNRGYKTADLWGKGANAKSADSLGHVSTLEASFEALSKPFLDRLDIFSNAIDLPDTLSALVFREYNTGAPHRPTVFFDKKNLD